MIRASGLNAVEALHRLTVKIWRDCSWPDIWKIQEIVLLHKGGSPKDCSNYRTIALLSHASKILLIILLNRLRQKFDDELPDEQAGFRRGRGTADMLCCIQNVIEKTLLMSERTFIVLIDYSKKVPVKLKVKIYQTVIKPTMLYGAECWAMRKKEEQLLNKTEMRMLHWIQGISLKDRVRRDEIRKRLNVMPIVDQFTKRRLSWYGHIKRRKPEDMTRTVLDMEIPGKRRRGRPRIRWMDNIRRDMILHGLDTSMTVDRKVWSTLVAKVDAR